MTGRVYAGVELGGTKCVAVLARGPGDIIDRTAVATVSPEVTLGAIEQVLANWTFAALGIASFGPADLDMGSSSYGQITGAAKAGWKGTDIARRLEAFAGVPMAFDTDVNAAALAETRWGCGRGMQDFAYITVGTGIGVGLIVNGRRAHGFAHPELGHIRPVRFPSDDFAGTCPYHGDCVEGLAAGPALQARIGGHSLDGLATDDPLWETTAWSLAQLCHAVVCATAPRAIAVGGGVMEKQPHLLERIERMLRESLAGYVQLPQRPYVRAPGLGTNAGPLGAIALAMDAIAQSANTYPPPAL